MTEKTLKVKNQSRNRLLTDNSEWKNKNNVLYYAVAEEVVDMRGGWADPDLFL